MAMEGQISKVLDFTSARSMSGMNNAKELDDTYKHYAELYKDDKEDLTKKKDWLIMIQ